MDHAAPHPERKHPAHYPTQESGNRAVIVFLTVCTQNRRPFLASPEVHQLLVSAWSRATHWLVGRYVVMPDHIHLFCSPAITPAHPLGLWVTYWQNLVTRSWSRPEEKPLWQKDHWDRQLRSGDSYEEKWKYVLNNPVRHKLCAVREAWPYQGELNVLSWHRR
jgi:putative transposase